MVDWSRLFNEIASEIYRNVKPILNTHQAEEIVGRGAGGDLTRYIDALAEEITIKALQRNSASCTLVSEECGTRQIGQNPKEYVVLDSVDGTSNAIRGIPFFCTSIALSTGPNLTETKLGLVKDLVNNETFHAEKGHGAYKDKKPLKPSKITEIDDAIISTELSLPNNKQHLTKLTPLILKSKKLRHLGATALEICYVASGSIDAFVDLRNIARSTDLAAAYIILKEAGGIMTTPDAEEINLRLDTAERTPFIAAANQTICNNILNLVSR